jgi:hypothetical protein
VLVRILVAQKKAAVHTAALALEVAAAQYLLKADLLLLHLIAIRAVTAAQLVVLM